MHGGEVAGRESRRNGFPPQGSPQLTRATDLPREHLTSAIRCLGRPRDGGYDEGRLDRPWFHHTAYGAFDLTAPTTVRCAAKLNDPAAESRRGSAPTDFMHSVRIRGQNYRISNETLDRVFGDNWRRFDRGLLRKHIEDQHDAGKLVVQGQRLQVATKIEEAEQQLRSAETEEEILRWGLLYVASQISEAATELRALRETLLFDESAATAKLSRDSAHEQEERG
jgi:hypothetical protein